MLIINFQHHFFIFKLLIIINVLFLKFTNLCFTKITLTMPENCLAYTYLLL